MRAFKRFTIEVTYPEDIWGVESTEKLVATTDWQTIMKIWDPFQHK